MKYAVYAERYNGIECFFFKTEEEAKSKINSLIEVCESLSVDTEENLHWDITLLEVKGECFWAENGLQLVLK